MLFVIIDNDQLWCGIPLAGLCFRFVRLIRQGLIVGRIGKLRPGLFEVLPGLLGWKMKLLDGCVDRLGVARLVSSVIECSCSSKERIGPEGFLPTPSPLGPGHLHLLSLFSSCHPRTFQQLVGLAVSSFPDPGADLPAPGLPGLSWSLC